MIVEIVDRRVLGAVVFIDATTHLRVISPLRVDSEGGTLIRNNRGLYVIRSANGLDAYTDSFQQQPSPPAPGAVALETVPVQLTITDPQFDYVPRRVTIRLPRDPASANAAEENSLFRPVQVPLFPSPAAQTASGWAVIRATVTDEATGSLLPFSLLRVRTTGVGARTLAMGLADNRGEALVAVPGIPVTTFGETEEDVVETEIDVVLEVVFDPEVQMLNDLESLMRREDPNRGYVPDPDQLNAEAATDTFPLRLASGRVLAQTFRVDLSP
jgi:hypothetical protein